MRIKTQIHFLKKLAYKDVWDFQTYLHNRIKTNKLSNNYNKTTTKKLNHLVFCEHMPVYTIGKTGSRENLLIEEQELFDDGFEIFDINRGGDITYHGPGQITGYLIFDLEELYRDVKKYVSNIEEAIIRTLKHYGITGSRVEEFTGVWIINGSEKRKICAIGVHLSRWVSLHGFGFNVSSNLEHFNNIIPCGIQEADKSVTTLSKELGREISVNEVGQILLKNLSEIFELEYLE